MNLIWCISITYNVKKCKKSMKQLKWPISLFSLCAVESFQLRRAEFDENSENLNAFFSMFSNGMTYFEGYHVKADVLRIPKKWYFLRFRGFKPELLLPKVRSFSKYLFWKVSVSKKNPTATILICRLQHWYTVGQIGMVWAWFNGETLRSKLWPWDFFWTPLIFGDKSKISESSASERL